MGASLSAKIDQINDLNQTLINIKETLHKSLVDMFEILSDIGACKLNKENFSANCSNNVKLVAVSKTNIFNKFNKKLKNYKIEAEYHDDIEKEIEDAETLLNYLRNIYKYVDEIFYDKDLCINYTMIISSTAIKIYTKELKNIKLSNYTINNLSNVATAIIKLLKSTIIYIKKLNSNIKNITTKSFTLDDLKNIEENIKQLVENNEINCCNLADILSALAITCNGDTCTNIFYKTESKFPKYDEIKLLKEHKTDCPRFVEGELERI